jgi:hypothetical protein
MVKYEQFQSAITQNLRMVNYHSCPLNFSFSQIYISNLVCVLKIRQTINVTKDTFKT